MVADINVLSSEDEDKYVLNAMKGNCDWTEVYSYGKDGGEMKWMDLLNNPSFMESEPLGEELAGMNLVIKVRENCYLSSTKEFEAKINPPAIPN